MSKRKANVSDLRAFLKKPAVATATASASPPRADSIDIDPANVCTAISVCSEPCHITDVSTLPKHVSAGRSRTFNVEWYTKFPWLHWQDGKLLCHTCVTANSQKGISLTKRTEDAFISKGMSLNWKKAVETFRDHGHSAGHLEAVEKMLLIKSNTSVISMLDQHAKESQLNARVALKIIATTILTLAQTGSPLRGHTEDHGNLMCWLNRRAEDVPSLKEFITRRESFLSHDIQNELLHLMANNVLRQVLADVKNSPYFSIMVDETTDVATTEQVSICVRMLKSDMQPT